MGFSVTASHAIFLVTALVAGATLGTVIAGSYKDVDERHRDSVRARADLVHTEMEFVAESPYPIYNATDDTWEIELENVGETVLTASALTFLVDGVYANGLIAAGPVVQGVAGTDLWMAGQRVYVRFDGVATEPAYFAAYAENGASVFYRRP